MDPVGIGPAGQRPLAVDRFAEGIDDPALPTFIRIDDRVRQAKLGPAAEADAVEGAERHHLGAFGFKSDDLAGDLAAMATDQPATVADGQRAARPFDLDQHADDRRHPTIDNVFGQTADFVDDIV